MICQFSVAKVLRLLLEFTNKHLNNALYQIKRQIDDE
jgi:hypothetical protein